MIYVISLNSTNTIYILLKYTNLKVKFFVSHVTFFLQSKK